MNKDAVEILRLKLDDKNKVEFTLIDSETNGLWIGAMPLVCSPDLIKALQALAPFMAHSNELTHGTKDVDSKTKTWIDARNEQVIEGITVTGVSFKGAGEKQGIVITGKRRVHHTGVALNSPFIHLEGENFGFEDKLAKPLDNILKELKAYVFDQKGTLFAKDKEPAKVDKEETVEV